MVYGDFKDGKVAGGNAMCERFVHDRDGFRREKLDRAEARLSAARDCNIDVERMVNGVWRVRELRDAPVVENPQPPAIRRAVRAVQAVAFDLEREVVVLQFLEDSLDLWKPHFASFERTYQMV